MEVCLHTKYTYIIFYKTCQSLGNLRLPFLKFLYQFWQASVTKKFRVFAIWDSSKAGVSEFQV